MVRGANHSGINPLSNNKNPVAMEKFSEERILTHDDMQQEFSHPLITSGWGLLYNREEKTREKKRQPNMHTPIFTVVNFTSRLAFLQFYGYRTEHVLCVCVG